MCVAGPGAVSCRTMTTTRLLIACALAACVCGCANSTRPAEGFEAAPADAGRAPGALSLRPGEYARAFDETKDLLRDLGFTLDRVDAQLGVLATAPKGSGGIATPWDREQTALADEIEDALQRQRRIVRIEFVAAGADPNSAMIRDLRTETGAIEAVVSATVQRLYQPGWRPNTQAILASSYTRDPQLDERGMTAYAVTLRQDDDLARWLAAQVRARLDRAPVK